MRFTRYVVVLAFLAAVAFASIGGCATDADKVNKNVSKKCEQFQCQRKIVGVNGITDKVEFSIEGRCSIEGDGLGQLNALTVTCKEGPGKNDYKKHYVGMSDNMFFISTQLQPIEASKYRTKIILKPQNIIPDFDLQTGG